MDVVILMKACKTCKFIIDEGMVCTLCQGTAFDEKITSYVFIVDAEKSQAAKELGITAPGRFAIIK